MPVDTFVENTWYVAGGSQEFPLDEPKGREIADRPPLIWRTRDRKVVAFDDRCVHKRMPLSEGRVVADGMLECSYHGLCYDAAGKCQRIPSQLDRPVPARAKLRPFPVVEQSKIPIEVVEETLWGTPTVKTVRRVQGYKQPPFMLDWWGVPVVDRWHTHHMIAPGLTRVELRCAPPGQLGQPEHEFGYVIHHAHTPIDATNSRRN